jgi:hypothetical protein
MNDMSDHPTIELTPIPNRPGYLASRLGVIFSTRRKGSRYGTYPPTPLTENVNGNGYKRVAITVNRITKQEFVHKLILETFVGPCPEYPMGNADSEPARPPLQAKPGRLPHRPIAGNQRGRRTIQNLPNLRQEDQAGLVFRVRIDPGPGKANPQTSRAGILFRPLLTLCQS